MNSVLFKITTNCAALVFMLMFLIEAKTTAFFILLVMFFYAAMPRNTISSFVAIFIINYAFFLFLQHLCLSFHSFFPTISIKVGNIKYYIILVLINKLRHKLTKVTKSLRYHSDLFLRAQFKHYQRENKNGEILQRRVKNGFHFKFV